MSPHITSMDDPEVRLERALITIETPRIMYVADVIYDFVVVLGALARRKAESDRCSSFRYLPENSLKNFLYSMISTKISSFWSPKILV